MAQIRVLSDDQAIVVEVANRANSADDPNYVWLCRSCGTDGTDRGELDGAINGAEYHADTCKGAER